MSTKKPEYILPKTLGATADRLYTLREKRLEVQAQADRIEAEERVLKEHLIASLNKGEAEGVIGKKAKASIVKQVVATVKDWDEFYKYVLKTKDFSLMQKRVNDAAVRERWDAKEVVPGCEPFNVLKVSVTKV